MALGGLVLGSLILYLKGIRIMMFQLSGFYYRVLGSAHGLHSSSLLGLPYRVLTMNPKRNYYGASTLNPKPLNP